MPAGSPQAARHATTLANVAIDLAREDGVPARRAVYLRPVRRLHNRCTDAAVARIANAVEIVASGITGNRLEVHAPHAAAAAVLVADAPRHTNCHHLALRILREIASAHRHASGSTYRRLVRFSPPLTAELALAAIRHALLPGKVRVVYALRAFSCQQAIYMGPAIGRRYRNSNLGAFVELTSGRGVGHGRFDANRVDRARITPLGRVGGQPCT